VASTDIGRDDQARALYAQHGGALLSYVRRLVADDRQTAEDIVQETLVRAWRHGAELEVATARPWLYTTARRLVIDFYRARRVRPAESPADRLDVMITPDAVDQALDAVLVADAVAALSPTHRAVIVECYYRGRSAAEVAQDQDIPVGTVRSRIHYALRALRLALQERGVVG
jgi:RNA polymerase sigma-70 factor (ECF subfamily)